MSGSWRLRVTKEDEWAGSGQLGSFDQVELEDLKSQESSKGQGPPTWPPLGNNRQTYVSYEHKYINIWYFDSLLVYAIE